MQSDAVSTVAIVVPSVRNPERLHGCLRVAREIAAGDGIEAEIIVVLDGAEPDVGEYVATEVEDATVLSWPERRGFAAALNAAGRATDRAFFAILQDDARPRPGWLRSLLDTACLHPSSGVVGCLVLGPDGGVRRAGAIIGGDGYTADSWVGPPPPPEHFTEVRAVDYLSSSSLLVRRAAWAAVGGFDEEMYPAVYVDADFCTALWDHGWHVLLDPRAVVVHEIGGSTSKPFREFLYHRNRKRFVEKWGACFAGRPTFPTGQGDPESVGPPGSWRRGASGELAAVAPPIEDPPIAYAERERDVLHAYIADLESRVVEPATERGRRSSRFLRRWVER